MEQQTTNNLNPLNFLNFLNLFPYLCHMSETLIKVDHVSKKFCRSLKRSLYYGALDIGSELMGRHRNGELRKNEFWALDDVSFELKRGECLGLIGHNGAVLGFSRAEIDRKFNAIVEFSKIGDFIDTPVQNYSSGASPSTSSSPSPVFNSPKGCITSPS